MTVAFAELRERADRRWQELNGAAWIRVGGGVSGEAAGCDEVIEAFNSELQSGGGSGTVSRVGMYGLCYAEPLVDIKTPGGPRGGDADNTFAPRRRRRSRLSAPGPQP